MPVWMQVGLALKLAKKIQKKVDAGKISDLPGLRDKFSRIRYLEKQKKKLLKIKKDPLAVRMAAVKQLEALEPLTEKWRTALEQIRHLQQQELMLPNRAAIDHHELAKLMGPREYEYEHFLVYYIYRYFMEGVYEGDLYWRVQFAAFSLLAAAELDLRLLSELNGELPQTARVEWLSLYSKEVEHSPENMKQMQECFAADGKFTRKELTAAIRSLLDTSEE